MKILSFLILLVTLQTAHAQAYIGKGKNYVKAGLHSYLKKHQLTNSKLTETDSTISMILNDTTVQPFRFVYHFDKDDRCDTEEMIAKNCDSCFNKLTNEILNNQKFEWVKLDGNNYASKFSKRLLLSVSNNGEAKVRSLYFVNWRRAEYEQLVKGKQ